MRETIKNFWINGARWSMGRNGMITILAPRFWRNWGAIGLHLAVDDQELRLGPLLVWHVSWS